MESPAAAEAGCRAGCLATCVKLNAKHPAGLNGLGQVLLQGGKLAEAEKVFLKAARTAQAARFGLARVQLLLGKYDAAAASLKALTKQGTGEIDPQLLKGMRLAASSKQLSEELREQLAPRATTNPTSSPHRKMPILWHSINRAGNSSTKVKTAKRKLVLAEQSRRSPIFWRPRMGSVSRCSISIKSMKPCLSSKNW